jgi:hypothetical protein
MPDEVYVLGNTGRRREIRARYGPAGVFTG